MKAVVKCDIIADTSKLMDIKEPMYEEDMVLLKVMAAGVCGSDIDMWNGTNGFKVKIPVVQGHEFCGIIIQVGNRVKKFKKGDRVVCETASYICQECFYCRTGQYNECPKRRGYGALVDGAFSEYVAVPERILHHIPNTLSYENAALTEPCCVAYNAMLVKSKVQPGKSVAIIGPGAIGLLCVAMAKLAGAYPIIMIGRTSSKARMEIADELGADELIYSDTMDAAAHILSKTEDIGIPLVCDCAGSSDAFILSMNIVARNGQITKVGWGPKPINISLDSIIQKAVAIQGAFSHTWDTWESVIRLIDTKKINLEPFSRHVYKIKDWEKAFSAMDSRKAVKSIILPNE